MHVTCQKLEVLYTNDSIGVSVYKGFIPPDNYVAVKEQVHQDLNEANNAIREAFRQGSLRHPGICQVLDCYLESASGSLCKSVILEELMECDLAEEITNRKQLGIPWCEDEIMLFLQDISAACLYAKDNKVCHRDIKPQNIFLGKGRVKLGDFGSSGTCLFSQDLQKTLHGSPFFLSPELKHEYTQVILRGAQSTLRYDPYKSDVYSLGVSFLYMALLEPPMQLMNLAELEETTERVLRQLTAYPKFREIVERMLVIDPVQRCSFEDIVQFTDTYFDSGSIRPEVKLVGKKQGKEKGLASEESKNTLEQPDPDAQSEYSKTETFLFDADWETSVRSAASSSSVQDLLEEPVPTPALEPLQTCCVCARPFGNANTTWRDGVSSPFKVFSYVLPRLCSENCLMELGRKVAGYAKDKCLGCKRTVDLLATRRPLLLKCMHCFHDRNCVLAHLKARTNNFTAGYPTDCEICKFPVELPYIQNFFGGPVDFFKKVKETSGRNICLSCGREANVQLPCSHLVCDTCYPLTCRKWLCQQCGRTISR